MNTIYKSVLTLGCLMACASAQVEATTTYSGYTAISGTAGTSTSEGYAKLVDGSTSSKWCITSFDSANIIFKSDEAIEVGGYNITTGNDNSSNTGRNPKSWMLYATKSYDEANADSTEWTLLHEVTDDDVLQDENYTSYQYFFPMQNVGTYQYFKLVITATKGSSVMQISEFCLTSACTHNLTFVAGEATTCYSYGTVAHWYCADCGTNFGDAVGKTVLTDLAASTTLAAHTIEHKAAKTPLCDTDGCIEHYYCTVCGTCFEDEAGTSAYSDPSAVILAMFAANDTIYVQDESSTSNSTTGIYSTYYNYGTSQNLYTAEEIGTSGTIASYALHCASMSTLTLKSLKVYMGETDDESLSTSSPFTSQDLTLVYDGSVTIGGAVAWEEITLDTPFEYSGTKNLVVALCTAKSFSSIYYYTYSGTALYRQNDDNSDYANIDNTSYGYSTCSRPAIRFSFEGGHPKATTSCTGLVHCDTCGTDFAQTKIDTITLDDSNDYLRKVDGMAGTLLTYTRNFAVADQWESFYVPFSFTYTDEEAEKYELAELHSYAVMDDSNEDGVTDSNDDKKMMIQKVATGSNVLPNVPYFIRAKAAGDIVFTSTDNLLYGAADGQVDCGTMREQFTLTGVNEAFGGLKSAGYYILSEGKLVKATDDVSTLSAYHWYMECSSAKVPDTIELYLLGAHEHADKDGDGYCDTQSCDYAFPMERITAEDIETLGLDEKYVGYMAVKNKKQLMAMCEICDTQYNIYHSDGDSAFVTDSFVLVNDIVINEAVVDADGEPLSGLSNWEPVSLPYGYIFDGNGHTISGLFSIGPDSYDEMYCGLFKEIGEDAKVCNLGITNSYLSYPWYNECYIGSIAAYNYGVIDNCWSDATIRTMYQYAGGIVGENMGAVTRCAYSGTINIPSEGNYANIGGIAGELYCYNDTSCISNCQVSATFVNEGEDSSIGGIVGYVDAYNTWTIENCQVNSSFANDGEDSNIGGIVGNIYSNCQWNVIQCQADGTLTNNGESGNIGGVVGYIYSERGKGTCYIQNCLNQMDIIATDNQNVGGIVGQVEYGDISLSACLNLGNIEWYDDDNTDNPQIIGSNYSDYLSVDSCYYLSDTSDDFDADQESYACTAEVLSIGKIGYKLSWYQNIGTDEYPVPYSNGHKTIYSGKQGDADFYVNDTIPSFTVMDGNAFKLNEDYYDKDLDSMTVCPFVAQKAMYDRTMSNPWGTICLPFSISYDESTADYSLFYMESETSDTENDQEVLNFVEFGTGIIPAGTPMAVKVRKTDANGKYLLNIVSQNAAFTNDSCDYTCGNSWTMKGTYHTLDEFKPSDADMYYIAQNQFWYAEDAVTMSPFRSWFEAPKSAGAATRRFVINEMGAETNITVVEDAQNHRVQFVFDLSGKRKAAASSGLNIVDGNKVLIK